MKGKKLFSNGLGKSDVGAKIIVWVLFAVLVLYVLSLAFVLGWGLLTSLKSNGDFLMGGNVLGFPTLDKDSFFDSTDALFKLENYKLVFENFRITDTNHAEKFDILFGTAQRETHVDANFWDMLGNSVIYSLGGAFVQTLAISLMAYLCAKYKFKFSRFIYTMVIALMALPIVGAYPAEISLLRNLGMYDTWWGNFIQKFGFIGMYFLVFYEHFDGMSNTYRDAASIDGANQWQVMTKIYYPLASKMFGSIMLVRFIFFWNDYSGIRMYMRTHPTLSYGVFYTAFVDTGNGVPYQVAGCMLLAIPILIAFICLQDKVMGSMTLGGLKE